MAEAIPTIAGASRAIRAGTLSPVTLVEGCLERIRELDPHLHAFVLVRGEAALEEARAAEREIREGHWRGPLHGIPIGLKDNISTRGLRTTACSRRLLSHVPAEGAAVEGRLRAAGAILLGKQTLHELALGGPSLDLPFPPARNPWDLERFTGASSTGSAAAVAAGLCLAAIATDAGGSIRGPAALCGIAGLKPGRGRVDHQGVIPLAPGLDTLGPLAWTAEDCGLTLAAIADGPPVPPPEGATAGGLRLGVARGWLEEALPDPAMADALERALAVLGDLGVEVVEVTPPPLDAFHAVGSTIALAEAFAIYGRDFRERPLDFGESFKARVTAGAFVRARDLARARRLAGRLGRGLLALFGSVDAILLPGARGMAPRLDEVGLFAPFARPGWYMPANVAGLPALVVCCGFADDRLPLGLQLLGPPDGEATLLRFGIAYERATPWRRRRPPLLQATAAELRPARRGRGRGG